MAESRNPIDVHVGGRIRLRRTLLGLSQEKLGDAVNLTFQQIQKYEKGANRVGASRLYQFARLLNVAPGFFFDEMPQEITSGPIIPLGLAEDSVPFDGDQGPLVRRETLEMVRSYYRIRDPQVRKRIFDIIKAIAISDSGPEDEGEDFES